MVDVGLSTPVSLVGDSGVTAPAGLGGEFLVGLHEVVTRALWIHCDLVVALSASLLAAPRHRGLIDAPLDGLSALVGVVGVHAIEARGGVTEQCDGSTARLTT